MPFDFLKRKKPPAEAAHRARDGGRAGQPRRIPFDGLTEDWRLVGADAGQRPAVGRAQQARADRDRRRVSWAPVDGSAPLAPAPGLKSVDPYDLIIVLAGDDSLPEMTDDERSAHRVHKVVVRGGARGPAVPRRRHGLPVPGLGAGEPARPLVRDVRADRGRDRARSATQLIGGGPAAAILVNRQYLRGVEQVDVRTGERHQKLPGSSLGGVELVGSRR